MKQYYTPAHERMGLIRIAECGIAPLDTTSELQKVSIYIVLFPNDAFSVAKQFWQHTGDIISSRMAEYCLRILDQNESVSQASSTTQAIEESIKPKHGMGRYGRKFGSISSESSSSSIKNQNNNNNQPSSSSIEKKENVEEKEEVEDVDQKFYVEERYGRNLPVEYADRAKRALRRRIAGVLTEEEIANHASLSNNDDLSTEKDLEQQRQRKGERGIKGLSEDDVYLFPSGMSAIFHAFRLATIVGDEKLRSVCFG